jgi:hypothetical protein
MAWDGLDPTRPDQTRPGPSGLGECPFRQDGDTRPSPDQCQGMSRSIPKTGNQHSQSHDVRVGPAPRTSCKFHLICAYAHLACACGALPLGTGYRLDAHWVSLRMTRYLGGCRRIAALAHIRAHFSTILELTDEWSRLGTARMQSASDQGPAWSIGFHGIASPVASLIYSTTSNVKASTTWLTRPPPHTLRATSSDSPEE